MATEDSNFPYGMSKNDADFLKTFHLTLKELRGFVISNVEFYQRGNSSIHAKYYTASCILFERLQSLEPFILEIVPKLQDYDFSPEVPGNGYRSFVIIVNRCILHLLQLCRHINVNKTNLLFRSSHYLKELEAYVETLGQLIACLGYLRQLISLTKDGQLFYEEENTEGDDILLEVEMLNTDCFYGRCLGFQFCESIQKLLQVIMVAMATFSECYEESSQVILLASSLLNSSKYIVDQDMRAKQVVNVTRTADIKFCKAFWSIPDSPVLQHLRSFTYPYVEVSELITLEPENFELPVKGSDDDTVTITPPCAHTGPSAVNVRLISHVIREGMQVSKKGSKSKKGAAGSTIVQPKSKGLLFHCHGGGFVAQSSQSHENYLRVWARKMKMSILSVDYSLAPELPFPRALEESFYAYAWALKNPELLGWSGELVCFAGDSAGGNLVLSTALRAISYQIRVPDGIMAAYTPMMVQYTPSPARLMSMIDPLLPVGILTRCLAAYAGIADKFSSALAKPIFCNPGKYESWEVVDSNDITTDSIGAQINKQLQDESDNQGKGLCSEKQELNAEHDNDMHGVTSSHSLLSNENSKSCQSIEDLEDLDDEFVICDTEDLIEDSEHYKGKVTVIRSGTDCDINTCDTGILQLDKPNNVIAVKENEPAEITTCQTSPKCVHQIQEASQKNEGNLEENPTEGITLMSSRDGINPEENDLASDTVDGALQKLDSGVVITVDAVTSYKVTDMPDGYAVCQDIVQDGRFMTVEALSDMDRNSCHSLEDINEKLEVDESRSDGQPERKKIFLETKNEKTNSSLTKRVFSEPDFSSCKEQINNLKKENRDCVHSEDGLTNQNVTDKLHRRAMSLDLPPYHQTSTPTSNSPSPVSRTPLSPKLPPGSRSYTPKRYSVQRKITQSPIKLFRSLPIVKNFYMSPMLAPDELLLGLPDIYLTACHFDPLLDDSVMFAKKLSKLGKAVDLQIMDYLPHGFLSFSDTSVEAKKAASVCLEKIMKVLKCEES